MNQKKIGAFLKSLRKEKKLTQEMLAEQLNVSNRSVSRWETGMNMPDISLLVELSEFYQVSISEIIDGERKNESMQQETKEVALKLSEYSQNELKLEKKKVTGILLIGFGLFIIGTAFAIFPNESSWSSIYACLGAIVSSIGLFVLLNSFSMKKRKCAGISILSFILLFGFFMITDYITVTQFHQVPRFSYKKSYGENVVEHDTFFYTVIQTNPNTEKETIEIVY
ncbi:helix-turn-helix domain-containing protein [Floccifex sp.]|uniref:helix-turn-helix domain-containing protein n=1 Tax=Floccifex sp. TaxID=2815810 RepID=UPI003F08B0E5